jgi:hypothetical protein
VEVTYAEGDRVPNVDLDTLWDLNCDRCGEPSEYVHLLPDAGLPRNYPNFTTADDIERGVVKPIDDGAPAQAVRFSCAEHNYGGYAFALVDWIDGPPHRRKPGEMFTARERLLTKLHGAEAVALVERAIEVGYGVGEWDGPANVPDFALALINAYEECRVCGEGATVETTAGHLCDTHQRCGVCGAPGEFLLTSATSEPTGGMDSIKVACARCKRVLEAGFEAPFAAPQMLPTFPVELLPPVLGDWIKATATATQTPVDLAACAVLAVLSACVAGSVVVEVRPGDWIEECVLYIVCALDSGDRKSAVVQAATKPLRAVERDRVDRARANVARALVEREAKEQRRRHLMTTAAKQDDPVKRARQIAEASDLAAELDSEGEPQLPRLFVDDATPEALAALLARHAQMAVIAAESAFLDNLTGRYSEGNSNLHLVCQAYTGESTNVDRRSHGEEILDRPLLTIALCVQPHVLSKLVSNPVAQQQGLVARFLIARPTSLLGRRDMNPPPVPSEVSDAWAALVGRLANPTDTTDATPVADTSSQRSVRSVRLSPAAEALLTQRRENQEPLLAVGGDLHEIAIWIARDAGRVGRIAALLHLASDAPGDEISADTMRASIAIADWALAHAIDVLTGPDPTIRRAISWLKRHDQPEVSVRDLHRGVFAHGNTGTTDDARRLVERLEEHGALRALQTPPRNRQGGRPPSPRYAVHPDLYEPRGGKP